jgi:hypothetical protein
MYDSGRRYRRQQAARRNKIILVIILIMTVAGLSYWWGAEHVLSSEAAYKTDATKLRSERAGMEQVITGLRAEVASTNMRYQQLEEKYKLEVPQDEFKRLTDLVKKQMDAGIKAERLALAIESARPPRNCSEPVVKRFVVRTPVYSGPQGAVLFGNGIVTIAGEGQPSVNTGGQKEAWYDPGKSVKIIFTEIGGKQTLKQGLLPIQNSMVIGNKEYRFTIAAGERSFISVTGDSCDYP